MTNFETKAAKEFSTHAKEAVNAEVISGTIYAFGSELACLRLAQTYRNTSDMRMGYSENMKTFYFSIPDHFRAAEVANDLQK